MTCMALRFFALLGVMLSLALPAAAQVSPSDQTAIRDVIEGQLEAFRRDDGDAAFGYAAPSIRNMFGSSETFMDMVRQGYRPVVVKRAEQLEPIGLWSDRDRDGAMIQRLERMARWLDGRPAAIVADMLWQARRRRYAASDAEWSAAAPSQRNASSAAP